MTIKKETKTVCWYVKWISTFLMVISFVLTSNNVYPINLLFYGSGALGWLYVGVVWKDRALIVLNAFLSAILINGLYSMYFGAYGT
jgi:hypothetical protein